MDLTKIKHKYNLNRVIIVNNNENKETQKRRVAQAAGKYLMQHLKKDSVVAIAGGTTVNEAIESITMTSKFPSTNFVSIVGGFDERYEDIQSNALSNKAAKKVGGKSTLLYAPVIVDSSEARNIFTHQTFIKNVFKKAKSADLALLGIGGPPNKNSSIAKIYNKILSNDKSFSSSDIVGDFCYQFINKEGKVADCEWNKRVISLDFKYIEKIPNVIAVAEGDKKRDSIIALLNTKLINTLIIDENTGNMIL